MVKESKRTEILDTAERLIRIGGYNAFSTREIADEIGIKAASVHYHFPKKSDLGVEVTDRYVERFVDMLGEPTRYRGNSRKGLEAYIEAFRRAFTQDRNLCLCAALGAEIRGLPMELGDSARRFFTANLDWLRAMLVAGGDATAEQATIFATQALAAMEGALLVALAMDDIRLFEDVAKLLLNTLPKPEEAVA